MTLKNTFKTSIRGLKTNKSRSVLTILGIVIGITAIILVMSLGQGAKELILGQIQGMGSHTIVVVPGKQPKGPTDVANVFLDSLKERDLNTIKNKSAVPFAKDIMPVLIGTGRMSYGADTYQATVLAGGSYEQNNVVGKIFDVYPDTGSFFSADDVKSRANVAVIGSKVKEKLFSSIEDPLNQKFKINGKNFKVVGILSKKGQVSFFNFDDIVLIPYTTAEYYLFGRNYFDRIIVSASSEDKIAQTVSDIKTAIRNNHGITDPDKDDFFIETQADLANRLSTILNVLTLFLASIAAISLLVGGVGIMNIMLVSVTERTREIGLRKALGATEKNILTQFLMEAVLLTLIGGLIGVALGAGLSFLTAIAITKFAGLAWGFVFPVSAALLGLGVSASVGLVFGIYPAREAARKSPIEALRYE